MYFKKGVCDLPLAAPFCTPIIYRHSLPVVQTLRPQDDWPYTNMPMFEWELEME